ncbi:hypothetical protein C8Q72DRAFT_842427 [Fomitopsis betulina]|nr:hypothetical protein C8Q72DRAFT_842427 [Fomitopsis betulina]
MGQYWKLLNIDREQELSFYAYKIRGIMYGVDPTRLVWLLAVPRKPPPYDRAVEPGHSTDTRDLGALNIPSDILELVFAQFEPNEIHAIISLSLTNTYLREIGQKQFWASDDVVQRLLVA